MLNQITNSWNSSSFCPVVSVEEVWNKPFDNERQKGFAIESISAQALFLGIKGAWKVEKKFEPPQKKKLSPQIVEAIALLDSWSDDDPQEQKETWEYLVKVLDEDRLSYRKFFPK